MADTNLRFEEKVGMFINPPEDRDDAPKNGNEYYVSVYDGDRKIAQIRENGNITYGEHWPNLTVRCVTITPDQRQRIDAKAREFQIKCAIMRSSSSSDGAGEMGQIGFGALRFEIGEKVLLEMEDLERGDMDIAKKEVLLIFRGRDEIGFITTDGKITLNGTRTPKELERLAGIGRWFKARSACGTPATLVE